MNAQRAARTAYDTADKVAENAVLKLTARFAMAAAFPVLGWISYQFFDMRDTQREITYTLSTLTDKLNERTQDRYTGAQAQRDWKAQDFRDSTQDSDRHRVEQRVDRIERRVFNTRDN